MHPHIQIAFLSHLGIQYVGVVTDSKTEGLIKAQTVRYYDTSDTSPEIKAKFDHRAAVLACTFSDDAHGYSGGLDTSVREYVQFYSALRVRRLVLSHLGLI